MTNRFRDARKKGRTWGAKMFFYNFAVHVSELHYTFQIVRMEEGNTELWLEVRGALLAFA